MWPNIAARQVVPRKAGRKPEMVGKIDQSLLAKIAGKAGIAPKTVYSRIYKIERDTGLEGQAAALALAQSLGIGIKRHSTPEQREAIARGRPVAGHSVAPAEAATQSPANTARRRLTTPKIPKAPKTKENTVFIVHGRDEALRNSMIDFLGALGLRTLEWNHAIRAASRRKGGNPYINDAVTKIMEEAQAIVVILSPDDEVKLRSHFVRPHERRDEGKIQFQARPNVLFETGIAIGTHHKKTVIVQVGAVKPFTDISGMHIMHLSGEKSRNAFANRLEDLGCKIDKVGDRWLDAGTFAPAAPIKSANQTNKSVRKRHL
jgi:predicted nucleotide-binding protein